MKTTSKGIDIIKKYEGCKLSAYRCPSGVLTIGYGHTDNVRAGQHITQQEADDMLLQDILQREKQIDEVLTADLNENQYDAVISFVFNVGIGNFARSTLLKKINANPDDRSIRFEWLEWCRSGKRILEGLVRRREEEITLYFSKDENSQKI